MKVLQIIQRPQLRGAEMFACQLAQELRNKNVEVDVAYIFDHPNNLPFDLKFIAVHGNGKHRFWDFKGYKALSDIIKKGEYDIVQANAGDTLKYASISKVFFKWKAPLVYRNANKMSDFIRSNLQLRLNRWLLSSCDYFISVSYNCLQDLIKLFPSALKKAKSITIGTYNFEDVSPAQLTLQRPIIINIGSLVPEKNHTFLLEIFESFLKKNKGTLMIVGEGKLRGPLQKKIEQMNLEERVFLMGARKDVVKLLKASDVLLMSSKIEGLPGVILEALSCGVPVVTSDVGGISEIISDRQTGFLVQRWDIDNYVSKIEEALNNDVLKNHVVSEGKHLIQRRYMMPDIAENFLITYRDILAKSGTD